MHNRGHGCPPAKEGSERSERALASVALAEEGGCFLDFDPVLDSKTKKQPPRAFGTSPPSQEGSLNHFNMKFVI